MGVALAAGGAAGEGVTPGMVMTVAAGPGVAGSVCGWLIGGGLGGGVAATAGTRAAGVATKKRPCGPAVADVAEIKKESDFTALVAFRGAGNAPFELDAPRRASVFDTLGIMQWP